jgi:hypothetical protein
VDVDPVTGKITSLATAAVTTDVEARLTQAEVDINAAEGSISNAVATLETVENDLSSAQSQIAQLANSVALGVSDVQISQIAGQVSGAITVDSAAASQALAETAIRQALGLDAATDKELAARARVAVAEQKIEANSDDLSAEASARLVLAAVVDQQKAALTNEQTARADALSAEAAARLALAATVAENTAAINDEVSTSANADAALAERINTVQASLGDDIASVQQTASASASAITGLRAKWSIKAQTIQNGIPVASGMELLSGDGESVLAVLANKFLFYQPDGQGTPKQLMTMGSINGEAALGFDGSAIFDGSISARQINGYGLNITGDGRFTGEVNVGAYTGYSWPAAGGTGVHLSVNGLLAGNANGGKYFQIYTPAGDWANAQILTNIPAYIGELTVDTIHVKNNAITTTAHVQGADIVTASSDWTTLVSGYADVGSAGSVSVHCACYGVPPLTQAGGTDQQWWVTEPAHFRILSPSGAVLSAQSAIGGICLIGKGTQTGVYSFQVQEAGTYVSGINMVLFTGKK